nr:Uma2 family endonuclease [Candidatus Sigynarchaeota archaeon]
LIIEILSLNRDLDLVRKKGIYEKYGVTEYWIVDPEEKKIHVYLLSEDKREFNPAILYSENDIISVTVMPSLSVRVKDIFK